jgi:FG-GAP-like repeat
MATRSLTTTADGGLLTIVDQATVSQSSHLNLLPLGGLWGRITDVRITLQGLTHTFPDDLDFLLVGPGGANLEFCSDAGGSFDITNNTNFFGDFFPGTFLVPDATQLDNLFSYRPADYAQAEDSSNWGLPPSIIINHPTPTGTATFASAFDGVFTGGTWSLYIRDDASGDVGSLMNWTVFVDYNVIVKPEDFDFDTNVPHPPTSDILWQNTDGTPAIWLMNGFNPTGAAVVGGNPGPSWHVKDDGDFNGDGKSDILWQNDNGTPAIWFMDGTDVPFTTTFVNPGPSWQIKGTGDFNGDFKADILWQSTDGTPAIWLIDRDVPGEVLAVAAVGSNPGPSWQIKGVGDFNGDSKADILWQNTDGTPAIWLMNGMNVIGAAVPGFNPGATWQIKDTGDFNFDGRSDILWQNTDGTPAIWLMDGLNPTGAAVVGSNPGPSWQVEGSGDYNGDGTSDILWQNANGTPAIWEMNGTNVIGAAVPGFNPGADWHVIA